MIALAKIRELDISSATSGDRPSYISAASGLVCVGSTFYVIIPLAIALENVDET